MSLEPLFAGDFLFLGAKPLRMGLGAGEHVV